MRKVLLGIFVTLLILSQAFGAGFNLYEHSASASTLGGAVVAHPNDISTIFYNPAGLAFMNGMNFYGGTTVIRPTNQFVGAQPIFDNTVYDAVDHTFASLGMYFSYQLNEKLFAGIGITNPYGLAIEWDEDFPGNALSRYTDLKSFYISPVIAYKVSPNFSVAAGIDIVYSTVDLEQYLRLDGVPYDIGKAELSGNNGLAYGFTFGTMYQNEKFGIGFMYRHQVENKYEDGDVDFTMFDTPLRAIYEPVFVDQKISTAITFPSNFASGIYYQVNPKLGVELDYVWFGWSVFDVLEMDFEDDAFDKEVFEGYNDSYQIRFGVNYSYSDKISLRAGYVYDQTPQPVESVSPMLPDNDRNDYSFGIGYKMNNMQFDLGYMLVDFGTRSTVENNIGLNHYGFNGEYSGIAHLFLISWGYSF